MTLSEPLKKSLLEAGRVLLLAVVSVAITVLTAALTGGDVGEKWATFAGIVLILLKSLDKFLHERGKETENDSLTLGLTRF